jgi:hypothetical protein
LVNPAIPANLRVIIHAISRGRKSIVAVAGKKIKAEAQLTHLAGALYPLGLPFGTRQRRRSMAARMAMMAITTSSSIRVNAWGA